MELSFSDVACKSDLLKGSKKGAIYLTPYRVLACHNLHLRVKGVRILCVPL